MVILAFSVLVALASPPPTPPSTPARAGALEANRLYSHAERRRIAAYLRLRLLEMQRDRLDGIAEVLRRRLSSEIAPPIAGAQK